MAIEWEGKWLGSAFW